MTIRCPFAKESETFYIDYHDHEWGVPIHNDRDHFELLILEGFQAGLSWAIILKRREAFRAAFHHFDPEKVAQMTDQELKTLEKNQAIIRNRRKIAATRENAHIFLRIQKEWGSFDKYVWPFIELNMMVLVAHSQRSIDEIMEAFLFRELNELAY